jgi:CRP/FNR family transcriptional regulator
MNAPSVTRWVRKFFKDDEHWDHLAFFRAVPLFHGLSARQLGRVMLSMQRRAYRSGEILFKEGQVGKAVFIIKSGQIELSRSLPDGGSRSLGVLTPGHMFGEMALLEEMQRTATATVVEDGEIFFLYTATLDSLIQHHPTIGVTLMKNMAIMLSALLRRTNKEVDQKSRGS